MSNMHYWMPRIFSSWNWWKSSLFCPLHYLGGTLWWILCYEWFTKNCKSIMNCVYVSFMWLFAYIFFWRKELMVAPHVSSLSLYAKKATKLEVADCPWGGWTWKRGWLYVDQTFRFKLSSLHNWMPLGFCHHESRLSFSLYIVYLGGESSWHLCCEGFIINCKLIMNCYCYWANCTKMEPTLVSFLFWVTVGQAL